MTYRGWICISRGWICLSRVWICLSRVWICLSWLSLLALGVATVGAQTQATSGSQRRVPAPAQSTPQEEKASTDDFRPTDDLRKVERFGDLQMARKHYRGAIPYYEKALRLLEPKIAVLYNKIGIAYHQQLRFDMAKKYYAIAIKEDRTYGAAINNLGTLYYGQKKYKSAIKQYKKALGVKPNSASIHSNLGTAYFARKKYDRALTSYRKALKLDPEVFERRSTYGVLLHERAVEDRARFHYFLAKTYAASGVLDRALLHLGKALEDGFQDRGQIARDPAFAELIKTEAYAQLMATPPAPLP